MDIESVNGETIQKLLEGSRNIDRMRAEVNAVVRMVLGLIDEWDDKRDGAVGRSSGVEGVCWSYYPKEGTWVVDCSCSTNMGRGYIVNKRHPNDYTIPIGLVQRVHSSLPVFLKFMLGQFPDLLEKIKPLLEAAEVQL
ncbi:MAG: hypothetical protein WC531_01310 [Candidatus Paceibacterota bacterium]|jgi:hypothetical protein